MGEYDKNVHSSPDISIYTDICQLYQLLPFLTNFGALGLNVGIPNHFRCRKVIYSSQVGLKIGE